MAATGSGVRGNAPNNKPGGLVVSFPSPNGNGTFQAVRWGQSEKGRVFTCFGYRTWTEKALDYNIPVFQKTRISQWQNMSSRKLPNGTIKSLTRAFDSSHTGKNKEATDGSYDPGSFCNGGSDGVSSLTSGRTQGIGYQAWMNARRVLNFPGPVWNNNVVIVTKNGTQMWRATIQSNGGQKGHNSLDLFIRTGADKKRVWNDNVEKSGGIFNNPGAIYIAPYDASKHSGLPWWGDYVPGMVTDDLFNYYTSNMFLAGECGNEGKTYSNASSFDAGWMKYSPYKGKYTGTPGSIKRTDVDCGSNYKGVGKKYKEMLDDLKSKEQSSGQGAFFSYMDPDDTAPDDYIAPYRTTGCAKYYLFKVANTNRDSGGDAPKTVYDICDEDGACQALVDEHEELDPLSLPAGAYLYVFVFVGWGGNVPIEGSDPPKCDKQFQQSTTSFHVWKYDHTNSKLKGGIYKNYPQNPIFSRS